MERRGRRRRPTRGPRVVDRRCTGSTTASSPAVASSRRRSSPTSRPGTAMAREEVFGPVIGFERVGSLDEAIASANDVDYGLSAAICTRSLAAAQQFAAEIQAGHGARQPADRRRRLQRPVRRHQAVGHGDPPRAARADGDGLLHRQPHRLAGELTWTSDLHGARALVLGSSSGLGRAVAAALAAEGAAVAVVSRDHERAEEARSAIGGAAALDRRPHRSPATGARSSPRRSPRSAGWTSASSTPAAASRAGSSPPTSDDDGCLPLDAAPGPRGRPGGRAASRRRRSRPARVPDGPLASSRRRPTSRCRR